MFRSTLLSVFVLALTFSLLVAQDEAKLKSGPKVGAMMPKPFECLNINGPNKAIFVEPKNKDEPGFHVARPHCLVCKFALSPAMVIFAKEPAEGKDAAFTQLLAKLDEVAAEFEDRSFAVGVVILSPDARDSTNTSNGLKAEEIIKETVDREKLIVRLKKVAEKLKHVIVACHPVDGPKGYDLNPKADLTAIYYERMKVSNTWAFGPEALDAKDVDSIEKLVRGALKKKTAGK